MIEFELIVRYMSGAASPDEAVLVDEWINESDENRNFYQHLYQSWQESGEETAYVRPDIMTEWREFQAKHMPPVRTKNILSFARIAAAACILIICGVGIWYANKNVSHIDQEQVAKASSNPLTIKLEDGSIAQLEQKAILHYPKVFTSAERKVRLEGDATFTVSHNKEKPFIINLENGANVKVLGTSFHIKQSKDSTWLKVITGKVAFYNKKDTLVVSANESSLYTAQSFSLIPKSGYIKTRTGSFNFNNLALSTVIIELQTYYKTNIVVENQQLNNCRITAKLNYKTLEEVIGIISSTLNIQFKTHEGTIYISGKGCN